MSRMEVKLIKPPQMSHACGVYIYIYTKFIVWCEGEERSIPLQVYIYISTCNGIEKKIYIFFYI